VAPAAIGEERALNLDERAWIESTRRSLEAIRCEVERERGERDRHD
jgi:hypothetical protein